MSRAVNLDFLTRRGAIKTGLIFSSALLTGWPTRAAADGKPRTDFGKNGMHFLALGDFGSGRGGQVKVAQQMNAFAGKLDGPVSSVLALGDNFYNRLEPVRFETGFEAMYSKEHLDCPFYACLGNHDYGPSYDSKQGRAKADMQLEYAKTHPDSRWKMPAKWYAVELPNAAQPLVKMIFLDGNLFEGALTPQEKIDQQRFLEAELEKKTAAKWLWVVSHYPLFSDDKKRKDGKRLIKSWGPYLHKYPVSLYLSGHDHSLQHLQIEGYQPSFLVSGGGGASLYETLASERGYSNRILWFNHIHVNDERIIVQLIDSDGNCLHAFRRNRNGEVKITQT